MNTLSKLLVTLALMAGAVSCGAEAAPDDVGGLRDVALDAGVESDGAAGGGSGGAAGAGGTGGAADAGTTFVPIARFASPAQTIRPINPRLPIPRPPTCNGSACVEDRGRMP